MLVAIIGTRCAGKTAVENYLVSKDFQLVRILNDNESLPPNTSPHQISTHNKNPRCFSSPSSLLDYVTRNWRVDFVTVDLCTRNIIEMFVKRPFFLLLSIDAPLFDRFHRLNSSSARPINLEEFVREDDSLVFGVAQQESPSSLRSLSDLVNIHIPNTFQDLPALHSHLDQINLLDPGHLRPNWDTYFMTLASLASQRSNCMKRRVGAVLVRENRILATGYNGTPRGLPNCNEGGCLHCNGISYPKNVANECVCLHAEENALLEAGRERVGLGAVLYCNTCPCLKCTIKIIQTGVKTVVYNLSYKVDDASAKLLADAGVELRRFQPVQKH
ncbi:cytidine deaminase-like protein [Mycena pura]|uniref:Deoxycytidylate deaminase n=1 Tax=Mycena pura TaxID=153505 RepID=A0AAD6YP06_9AGAR|nr:cytidine deaminase-like protein [Mycena pura]